MDALIKQAHPRELYKSLTWDRGKEMDHKRFWGDHDDAFTRSRCGVDVGSVLDSLPHRSQLLDRIERLSADTAVIAKVQPPDASVPRPFDGDARAEERGGTLLLLVRHWGVPDAIGL